MTTAVGKGVTFEVAIETLAAYLGYIDRSLREESQKERPDELKLLALKTQRDVVVYERKQITPQRLDLIGKSVYVYAPFVKGVTH